MAKIGTVVNGKIITTTAGKSNFKRILFQIMVPSKLFGIRFLKEKKIFRAFSLIIYMLKSGISYTSEFFG